MKGLTLYQPWASAIAVGLKRVETRGWSTKYTGDVAIHAALEFPIYGVDLALKYEGELRDGDSLPYGKIVAVARLYGCRFTEDVREQLSAQEIEFGDYSDGRFAFFLQDVRPLKEPIPFKGSRKFWPVPVDLEREIRSQVGWIPAFAGMTEGR